MCVRVLYTPYRSFKFILCIIHSFVSLLSVLLSYLLISTLFLYLSFFFLIIVLLTLSSLFIFFLIFFLCLLIRLCHLIFFLIFIFVFIHYFFSLFFLYHCQIIFIHAFYSGFVPSHNFSFLLLLLCFFLLFSNYCSFYDWLAFQLRFICFSLTIMFLSGTFLFVFLFIVTASLTLLFHLHSHHAFLRSSALRVLFFLLCLN